MKNKRLKKALLDFVETMNGQTFSDNKSYKEVLELIAKEYFIHCYEIGYSEGCEKTHQEHVAYIIEGEQIRY